MVVCVGSWLSRRMMGEEACSEGFVGDKEDGKEVGKVDGSADKADNRDSSVSRSLYCGNLRNCCSEG